MSILAIDPGTTESAIVWWQNGEIAAYGKYPNDSVREHVDSLPAARVVCEMIASYGMPVGKETFETVRWIGRFEQVAIDSGKQFDVIYRKDVKMHLCQSMRAKDGNVRQALIDRFGAPGTKKAPGKLHGIYGDVWSALAVAVTFADKQELKDWRTAVSHFSDSPRDAVRRGFPRPTIQPEEKE